MISVDASGQPVAVDLDGAAHVLASTCSVGGRLTILLTLTVQLLHHRARELVLDMKWSSQPWARELPTVTYRSDVADIHDALVGRADELRRRIDVADRNGDDAVLLRLVVVFENGDVTLRRLACHWETVRRPGDPRVPPAFTVLTDVLFAGAMVRMNVLFDGDPTLSASGRKDASSSPPSSWGGFPPAPGAGSRRRPAPPPRTAGARTKAASTPYSAATPSTRRRC